MTSLTLYAPDNTPYKLDTPDPALIGPWLCAMADLMVARYAGPPGYPNEFRLVVIRS